MIASLFAPMDTFRNKQKQNYRWSIHVGHRLNKKYHHSTFWWISGNGEVFPSWYDQDLKQKDGICYW
jgi:hypothetical protein